MSEPHKYHQRPKVVLQANLARGDIKEFLNGFSRQAQGAFGNVYCPVLDALNELEIREAQRGALGHKVDSSIFDRDVQAYLLRNFRKQGLSNFVSRLKLVRLERQIQEYAIGKGHELNEEYLVTLKESKPSIFKLLIDELGFSKNQVKTMYGNLMNNCRLAVDRAKYHKGLIDRHGREADEYEQAALLATNQFALGRGVSRVFA